MPVYNSERFIRQAITSILEQTFHDFEFLIIDDGSTDNSEAIVQAFRDSRIRFFRNEKNLGITATLNKGILLAQTPYLARMDADDISYPDRLQKQVDYLEANPDCGMVSSLTRVIDQGGKPVRVDKFKSEHYYYNQNFICWIYHPTVMYRKQALLDVNLYTASYSEDFEIFWQISRTYKIHNLDEVLLDYRETDQSLHQVLKKSEYEAAQQQQVLRNIQFYTGSAFPIPLTYLECYRHHFDPLLKDKHLHSWVKCIKTLDHITCCILGKENVNRNPEAIKKAARYKRDYIVSFYAGNLPFWSRLLFLVQVISIADLLRTSKAFIGLQFRKAKTKPIRTTTHPQTDIPPDKQPELTF